MKEIKPLTSLRGIFALWVVGYHLRSLHPALVPVLDPRGYMLRGYLGVDFFFLLSGFVLAGAAGKSVTTWAGYVAFVRKRARRLFPLHLIVLGVVASVMLAFGSWPGTRQLLVEGTLVHRIPWTGAGDQAFNGPDWSISTELIVNIAMPAIVLVLLESSEIIAGTVVLALYAPLIWLCSSTDGTLDHASAHSWLPLIRCFCEFSIGVALFRFQRFGRFLPALQLLVLSFGLAAPLLRIPDLVFVPLFALSILAVAAETGVIARALAWSPLHKLGEISFSIYLVHLPVLYVVRWTVVSTHLHGAFGLGVYLFGTVGITIAVSMATYSLIEQRFKRPRQPVQPSYQADTLASSS